MIEEVVLVDEKNTVLGTMPKSEVHGRETPLHRGFSLFLFNEAGELLVQQRSSKKKTWPLVWSNSCCGHPGLGESNTDAAVRRLQFELGLGAQWIEELLPYRYQVMKDGVMENEICPILLGVTTQEARANPDEVESTHWIPWEKFLTELQENSALWSPWCIEEAALLGGARRFQDFRAGKDKP